MEVKIEIETNADIRYNRGLRCLITSTTKAFYVSCATRPGIVV